MAPKHLTEREWFAFEDWKLEEFKGILEFRLKFMTEPERAEWLGPPEVQKARLVVRDGQLVNPDAKPEPEMSDEEWQRMAAEIQAEEERERADLLGLAEKLECSVHLAAYLRHLSWQLDVVAEAFERTRASALPKKIRRRK